jgi:hypothetical protein
VRNEYNRQQKPALSGGGEAVELVGCGGTGEDAGVAGQPYCGYLARR